MKKIILYIICIFSLIGMSAFATPNAPKTPLEIIQDLYQPYLDDPHAEKTNSPDALNLILLNASTSLKLAIEKEQACQKQEEGICGIDFDIIINAQDWDISNFKLKEINLKRDDILKNGPGVDATFVNGGKNLVRYSFVQENGEWKIENVQATRFNKAGKIEHFSELISLLNYSK